MLTFFNTRTHQKEVFVPIKQGEVRFYGCGPTVYNYAHIGNLRAYIFYDLLNRYLRYKGYKVTFAMNLTDVDDKTIRDSRASGKTLREFTDFYADRFFEDCSKIHILKPDIVMRATEEIDAMVELIELLLEKGYAYKTAKGDVFFKISRFSEYGQMAGIDTSKLRTNADGRLSDEYEKEDAQDFALWKAYEERDGDNFWETPFGKGRPGWSLECSAMARKYLGQPLDIHVGGVDLIFPHHTNEIAQSECAYGCRFVNYWLHNAHITVNGKKMSKSAGNFFVLNDLLKKGYTPEAIRYEFIKAHYRLGMDFQESNLKGNQTVVDRLNNFIYRLKTQVSGKGWPNLKEALKVVCDTFERGLDDDLNISISLAGIFDFITLVNKNFEQLDATDATLIIQQMNKFDTVLGILKCDREKELTEEQKQMIENRQVYRENKQWALADDLKKKLRDQGIEIKDTPTGPVWHFIES